MATIAELDVTLAANADYSADDSLSKATAYESALLEYIRLMPSSQSDQGSSLAYDMATLRLLLNRVTAFINAKNQSSAATSRVRFLTFSEGFRR